MDVTQIPFNKFLEIVQSNSDDCVLELGFNDNMKNHLGTFHASAQFALAEACSGLSLQRHFPHLENSVAPILRKSEIKFKNPAQSGIYARAHIDVEKKERFKQQFEKKGRATIAVPVEVIDQNGVICMSGRYKWFVQKLWNILYPST
jgi:acyl-coenzyme A thioesterase PaaI-like protein